MKYSTIIAPEGYLSIPADIPYYFLGQSTNGYVVIANINKRSNNRGKATAIRIARDEFEEAISNGTLILVHENNLPPWLAPSRREKTVDLSKSLDRFQKKPHTIAQQRLEKILTGVNSIREILDAEDPNFTINQICRKSHPTLKTTRFRFWLLSYLCFGQDIRILEPSYQNAGHWDRSKHGLKKAGAPNKAFGRKYGFRMAPNDIEKIRKFYAVASKLGKSMQEIHAESLGKIFGCVPTRLGDMAPEMRPANLPLNAMIPIHPENKPFPSLRQFSYHVKTKFGLTSIQLRKHGRVVVREKKSPVIGQFSQSVKLLLEMVEGDARVVPEHPRGYIDDSPLPKLRVMTASDILSSAKVGIGFSFGGESLAGYKMMMFSMAVGKKRFCRLFGLEIQDDDWPMQGLPMDIKFDNGPGSSKNLTTLPENKTIFKTITGSYSGQSKATVESSHRKKVITKGEPTYRVSNLSPVEMMRREILDLIYFNKTTDVSGKIDHEGALASVFPTPNGLWGHYANLLRIYNRQMAFDTAVREYLTPKEFRLSKAGIHYDNILYKSEELVMSGILHKVATGNTPSIYCRGYILDMALRYVWVEISGHLFELEAQLKTRQDEAILYFTELEHQEFIECAARVRSAAAVHAQASRSAILTIHEEVNGKDWNSGQTFKGRFKKTATTRQETKEIDRQTGKRSS